MNPETWPDPAAAYDYPERTPQNKQRWPAAINAARANGSLKLMPGDHSTEFHDLVGKCPRCGHGMDQSIQFNVEMIMEGTAPMSGDFNIYCNCTEPHQGRDGTHQGCGWGGWIPVPISIDDPPGEK